MHSCVTAVTCLRGSREEEEEEETLCDHKCTIHHISDTKLDIKQCTHTSLIQK